MLTLARQAGHSSWPLLMSMSEAFSLLYFNKTLLHKSSEQSSLVSGPGLNSSPPEAKNPTVFHGSASPFRGGGAPSIQECSSCCESWAPRTRCAGIMAPHLRLHHGSALGSWESASPSRTLSFWFCEGWGRRTLFWNVCYSTGAEVLLTGAPPKVFSVDINYLNCSSYLITSFSVPKGYLPSDLRNAILSSCLSFFFF